MAIGIYKPGQGYWVRVLTAVLIAVITLAAAAWTFEQMKLVTSKMSRSVWAISLSDTSVAPAPGQSITLLGKPASSSQTAPEIGTGTVESFSAGAGELRINNVTMKDPAADPSTATAVQIGTAKTISVKGVPLGETAINPFLLQGMITAVVLLLGTIIAYYFTAMYPRFCDFLIATDGEMKKVNWSTQRDIRMSTLVVIFAAVMLSGTLFIVDFGFQWFFKSIGVLVH